MEIRLNISVLSRLLAALIISIVLGHLASMAWLAQNNFVIDRWSWLFNLGHEKITCPRCSPTPCYYFQA